jgi:glycosyltransferase involved in cell wall biosynthesis
MSKITVCYFPLQAHCFAFGGFEIQMLSAYDAINEFSKDILNLKKIDVWKKNIDFEIAHFWGLEMANFNNVYWANKSGKKVVLTVLLSYYDKPYSKLKHKISSYIHNAKYQLELLKYVDALVVVNDEQRNVASSIFKFDKSRIYVIPNIIHDNFIKYEEVNSNGQQDYVLITGNVCKRKNQLTLAKACAEINKNLIIVGKEMPGEENYAKELQILVDKSANIKWIKGLTENSDQLISLIKNCFMFALPSFSETQPISLLEAAFCQKPLLISNNIFAKQKYYENAYLVETNSIESIKKGLISVFSNPSMYVVPQKNLVPCTKFKVAESYTKVYLSLIDA